mmetsp:Transcript_20690/g.25416  ORF Transcript_20690/g.25416 Transcript_20690/m.25416 type:complete len:89 (-) Transcript_20690:14-280(-)
MLPYADDEDGELHLDIGLNDDEQEGPRSSLGLVLITRGPPAWYYPLRFLRRILVLAWSWFLFLDTRCFTTRTFQNILNNKTFSRWELL